MITDKNRPWFSNVMGGWSYEYFGNTYGPFKSKEAAVRDLTYRDTARD